MIQGHPGIEKYLPADETTVYNNYAIPIDKECREELQALIEKLPGLISISMDGATVNGKHKVSY